MHSHPHPHPLSGTYYDGNTGYYFFPTTNQWCTYDAATGQYTAVPSDGGTDAAAAAATSGPKVAPAAQVAGAPTTAGQGALAATESALFETKRQQHVVSAGTVRQAPGAGGGRGAGRGVGATRSAPGTERRKGAVIGAAPQYNPQGLLLAAQQLSEREAAQKALAAQQAKAAAQQRQQGRKVGPKPTTATPGLGSMNLPQQASIAQRPAAAAAATAVVGQVQGVVHKGKWSQRNQANS